jgi:hypothetical protein
MRFEEVVARFEVNIQRMLRPGVGQLGTYSPQPVSVEFLQSNSQQPGQTLPRITIVVPSFNQGRFIGATLQSIIDQQYPNLELMVVDGGSSDNTLAVIRQYEPHIAWWVSESDSGQTAAINKGFARSTGEILVWINSDDLVASGALHLVAGQLAKRTGAQVVYGNRVLINEDGLEIGRWILPRHSNRVLKWLILCRKKRSTGRGTPGTFQARAWMTPFISRWTGSLVTFCCKKISNIYLFSWVCSGCTKIRKHPVKCYQSGSMR